MTIKCGKRGKGGAGAPAREKPRSREVAGRKETAR
jgi:hypothetical protein